MKTLLSALIAACVCLLPVATLAGNAHPTLYLEIYAFDNNPDDPGPAPPYVCAHPSSDPVQLQCYAPKAPYTFAVLPIHIGNLDTPPLAEGWPAGSTGPGGGFVCVTYGVSTIGAHCTYVSFSACPGFLIGPSNAGMPAACLSTATTRCHDWVDHPGYLTYFTATGVGDTYFNIVANADEGYARVINCQFEYDMGTQIGAGAQWGGTQTVVCPWDSSPDPTSVEETTWGRIKGLYR